MTAEGLNVAMKRQRGGYRVSLRLQQQVAHLQELIQQEEQVKKEALADQMLLANAILLHRVTQGFMHPLYRQWAREDSTGSAPQQDHDNRRLSQLPLVQATPNWQLLVQLAGASSNMTRRLLMVTPERVRTLAAFTLEDAWQLYKECSTGMIMLSELLLPARYPEGLMRPADQPAAAAQAEGHSAPTPGLAGGATDADSTAAAAEEVTEAAQQLLARLKQYEALIHKLSISVSVLLGLQPTILIGLAAMDLETGKQRSPPSGHFLQAAKRLHLTGPQLKELMRIRQLSNRMVSAVQSTGMQLVGRMADSFGVQTSLSAATSNASTRSWQQSGTAQQQSDAANRQTMASSLDTTGQREQGDLEDAVLEQLMQQHMHNIEDFLLVVQANWAVNLLTPWQHGLYASACWPFQASMGALVELAPLLKADDSPPLQINAAACPEAAAAATLGAELGYIGPQHSMQQRHDAMDVHLAWVLQELGLLQQ